MIGERDRITTIPNLSRSEIYVGNDDRILIADFESLRLLIHMDCLNYYKLSNVRIHSIAP
ncbi:MAG: hypothetical protein ACI8UO_005799 [Verrucomicrobiales bacterium]|jgi:hypothetical protein